MADYFRVGPPWGIVNFVKDPGFFHDSALGTASSPDPWTIAQGSIIGVRATGHPSLAIPGKSMRYITAASGVAGNALVQASFGVPTQGYFVAEAWVQAENGSAARLIDVVTGASGPQSFINPLVASGAVPLVGTWTRIMAVYDWASIATVVDSTVLYMRIRQASAPSGAFEFKIYGPRLSLVPQPTDMVGSYYTGYRAAGAGATPGRQNVVWLGEMGRSWNAREPADPTFDYAQPVGQAVEVGSMIVPGELSTNQDVIQQTYNQQVQERGGRLLYEAFPNRVWQMPFIFQPPSGSRADGEAILRQLHQAAQPSMVLDFRPQDASFVTRFDVQGGRLLAERDLRYRRANVYQGSLELTTEPFGYTPTWMVFANPSQMSFMAGGSTPTHFHISGGSVVGDIAAPMRVQLTSIVDNSAGQYVGGFLAVENFLPSGLPFVTIPMTFNRGTSNSTWGRFPMMTASANTYAITAGDLAAGIGLGQFTISAAQQRALGRSARVFLNAGRFDSLMLVNASVPVALRLAPVFGKSSYSTVPVTNQGGVGASSWSGLFDMGVIPLEAGENVQQSLQYTIYPATSTAAIASGASYMLLMNSVVLIPADVQTSRVNMTASNIVGQLGPDSTNGWIYSFDQEENSPRVHWGIYSSTNAIASNRYFNMEPFIRGDVGFMVASEANFGAIPMYYHPSMLGGFLGHPTRPVGFQLVYRPHWLFVR